MRRYNGVLSLPGSKLLCLKRELPCVCLSLCLPVYQSLPACVCLSVYMLIYLSTYLLICLSTYYISICLSIDLSNYPSIYLLYIIYIFINFPLVIRLFWIFCPFPRDSFPRIPSSPQVSCRPLFFSYSLQPCFSPFFGLPVVTVSASLLRPVKSRHTKRRVWPFKRSLPIHKSILSEARWPLTSQT